MFMSELMTTCEYMALVTVSSYASLAQAEARALKDDDARISGG